jgi:hypothetical protein
VKLAETPSHRKTTFPEGTVNENILRRKGVGKDAEDGMVGMYTEGNMHRKKRVKSYVGIRLFAVWTTVTQNRMSWGSEISDISGNL